MVLRVSRLVLLTLVFIFIFGLFSVKVWDPDFWWHLKTGEYIWQTGSLPDTDPFAYTSLPKDPIHPESKRIKFILKQYWLAQVLMYLVYKMYSFRGIIFLRAGILTLLSFFVYLGIRREQIKTATALLILTPAVILLSSFTGERPQLFSFLFSFILIYVLEGYRLTNAVSASLATTDKPAAQNFSYLIPIPLIMLVWANLHGGFIVGLLIISGYMSSEILKFSTKRFGTPLTANALKYLIIISILSILFSFINPNGYNAIPTMFEFEKSIYSKMVTETMSPFKFMLSGHFAQESQVFLLSVTACIVLFLANIKYLDITDIIITSGFFYMSAKAGRAIPFFVCLASMMVARYGHLLYKRISTKDHVSAFLRRLSISIGSYHVRLSQAAIALLLSFLMLWQLSTGHLFQKGVHWYKYPTGAVNFLKTNKIPGNMFNPYVWGGYLIWSLYPDYKVFIDGRGLIEEVFLQATRINSLHPSLIWGMPEWKAFLNAYNVNFILTDSVGSFSGKLGALVSALIKDTDWRLIYFDNNSLIFMKDSSENADIIAKFGMPNEWALNEVIKEASLKSNNTLKNINFSITIGDAFAAKKDYASAKIAYLKAKQIEPDNPLVKQKLESIDKTLSH